MADRGNSQKGNANESGQAEAGANPRQDTGTQKHRSKTAGTNRDFDDSGEAVNQGHGHPREERDRSN